MAKKSDANSSSGESSPDDRMDAAQANTSWKKDDHILCKWQDDFYYEGKIYEVTENAGKPAYRVRYPGWGKKYDELVVEDEVADRFQPFSEQKKKEEMEKIKEARSSAKSKKRKSSIDTPSAENIKEATSSAKSKKRKSSIDTPSAEKKIKSTTPLSKKVKSSAKSSESKHHKKLPDSVIQSPLDAAVAKTPKVRKQAIKKEPLGGAKLSVKPIELTQKLKGIIETDLDFICDKDMLPSLPARFTVQSIISQYIGHLNGKQSKLVEEDSEGSESDRLQANKTSAQNLLTSFTEDVVSKVVFVKERPMFTDLLAGKAGYGGIDPMKAKSDKEFATKDLSAKLGIVYLLRVLVHLHKLIGAAENDKENGLDDFVQFLDEHAGEFYLGEEDYYLASIEYIGNVSELFSELEKETKMRNRFLQ